MRSLCLLHECRLRLFPCRDDLLSRRTGIDHRVQVGIAVEQLGGHAQRAARSPFELRILQVLERVHDVHAQRDGLNRIAIHDVDLDTVAGLALVFRERRNE